MKKVKADFSFDQIRKCVEVNYQGERVKQSGLGTTQKDFTDLGEIKDSEVAGIS